MVRTNFRMDWISRIAIEPGPQRRRLHWTKYREISQKATGTCAEFSSFA